MWKKLSARSSLKLGARDSRLSRAQVEEFFLEFPHLVFEAIWFKTTGDLDQKTSLRTLEKTDFFTKELDLALLAREIDIAVHSAKDLPDPLSPGLVLAVLTKGVDPSDVLVFNKELPLGGRVGTSSLRREKNILEWRPDLKCIDIRGTIEQRLALLDEGHVEGIVMAEAALIRLQWTHRKRMKFPGETAPLQGRLAVVCREEDLDLFNLI